MKICLNKNKLVYGWLFSAIDTAITITSEMLFMEAARNIALFGLILN